jgi:cytochrome c
VRLIPRPLVVAGLGTGLTLALGLALGSGLGCSVPRAEDPQLVVPGADADRAPELMATYGCGSCHRIPGVDDARGDVGPPLARFGRRRTIAGLLPNRPDTLVRWLVDPQEVKPGVDMPDLELTEDEAADVAAYLLSLR